MFSSVACAVITSLCSSSSSFWHDEKESECNSPVRAMTGELLLLLHRQSVTPCPGATEGKTKVQRNATYLIERYVLVVGIADDDDNE